MSEPRHSEPYLTDLRDGWWNRDWLALVAARVGLGEVRRALDVGCGHGHWTRMLAPYLHPEAEVDGVEREADWVAVAASRAGPRQRYTVGTAEALPFADETFDLVTCQTLLIHVRDPARVIAEMRRVLRPGGQVLLAEPNNLPNAVAWFAPLHDASIDDLADVVRFQAMLERGKRASGEGYNSLGEELPGLLREGWTDVETWSNDRTRHMWPPYDAGIVAEERATFARGEIGWTRAEAQRWFFAAGGDEAGFVRGWDATLRLQALRLSAIAAGTYAASDGSFLYVVRARRTS